MKFLTKITVAVTCSAILISWIVQGTVIAQQQTQGADDGFVSFPGGAEVSVSPPAFSYDDDITITMHGLPEDFPMHPGYVRLGDERVRFPGYFGDHGVKPMSDGQGTLVFTTKVPDGLRVGPQFLTVDVENIFLARSAVELRPISLHVSASTVVPNQEVWVMGQGFTPRSAEDWVRHRVERKVPSGVALEGLPVDKRFIDYPVNIDRDGALIFKLVIPGNKSTTQAGQVELRVTDTEGRVGTVTLTIPGPVLSVSPGSVHPQETLTFSASGLQASNPALGIENKVNVEYGRVHGKGAGKFHFWTLVGQWATDDTGSLSGTFPIPKHAKIPSSNQISIKPTLGEPLTFFHRVARPSIRSDPKNAFPGDAVEITIRGLEPESRLGAASVTLAGEKVSVPGYWGRPGPVPVAGITGTLTFTSYVPMGMSPGEKQLKLGLPDGSEVDRKLTIKEGDLELEPATIVPGESLELTSGRFGSVTDLSGERLKNVQVSGLWGSFLFVNGARWDSNTVDYPIEFDKKGRLRATVEVPINEDTIHAGRLEFTTVDTAGRTSRGSVLMKGRSVTVSPTVGFRGTFARIDGASFPANKEGSRGSYQVLIDYAGIPVATATPDEKGAFTATFKVPSSADVNSAHTVTAVLEQFPSVKSEATHQIPDNQMTITPAAAPRGGTVSISGRGFRPFRMIVIGLGHLWMVLPPMAVTDINGDFETEFVVPAGLEPGAHALSVYMPYPSRGVSTAYTVAPGEAGR